MKRWAVVVISWAKKPQVFTVNMNGSYAEELVIDGLSMTLADISRELHQQGYNVLIRDCVFTFGDYIEVVRGGDGGLKPHRLLGVDELNRLQQQTPWRPAVYYAIQTAERRILAA